HARGQGGAHATPVPADRTGRRDGRRVLRVLAARHGHVEGRQVSPLARLVLTAAALELFCGAFGFLAGGPMAMAAAFVGATIATGAQIVAVLLLRPAMQARTQAFQQRWVLGMVVRFGSFVM